MTSKKMIEPVVVMGLSFCFGLLFWVIDSYFEYKFFHKNLSFLLLEGPENFMESLVFKVPLHSLFVRCSFFAAALLGGSLTTVFLVNKAKSDAALRFSEEKFRNLFNNAEVAMFRTRLDGSETLDVNQRFLDIVGKTRVETLGNPSIILWENPKEREKMVERLVANGSVSELEFKMLNKEKGVRNCITSLRLYREQGILEGSIADITERKQAEETLRKSEEKYRTILENIEDGYFEVTLTGTLTFFNDSLCQIWGYGKEELLGMTYRQYTDPDNAKKLFQTFRKVYKTGKPAKGFDWQIRSKDGTKKNIEASVSLLKNSSDKPTGFRGIVRDTTERKRAEEERARLQNQLIQAQKMESVGQLAGGVAHDFNNMLGVILGHAEMAMEQVSPNQPLYADLEEIRQAAERSADITRQLLAFARKQTIAPKVLDLNET